MATHCPLYPVTCDPVVFRDLCQLWQNIGTSCSRCFTTSWMKCTTEWNVYRVRWFPSQRDALSLSFPPAGPGPEGQTIVPEYRDAEDCRQAHR